MKHILRMLKNNWFIDIGNSSLAVAYQRAGKLIYAGAYSPQNLPEIVTKIAKSGGECDINVIIASVVPEIGLKIGVALRKIKGVKLYRVGQNLPLRVKNAYRYPRKLGIDRQVNVYGALQMFKPPFLIFDFGSATTVDYVDAKGCFQGGLICLGAENGLRALHEKTALLPRVELKTVKGLFGNDTRGCMLAGAVQGHAAMVDGLIRKFRGRYGSGIKAIATGGLADIIFSRSDLLDYRDRLLTLRSMSRLFADYQRNNKRKQEKNG